MAKSTGEILEGDIAQWIWDHNFSGVHRPYIWPGSWPDQDLVWAEQHLARPEWNMFDGMIIYYEAWDPEMPTAVERWNQDQDRWHARIIHHDGVWRAPRDLMLIVDRHRADQVIVSMWLGLGERP